MTPFFVSMLLLGNFWGWLVFCFYFLLIGIYFLMLLIHGELKNVKSIFGKVMMKSLLFLVSIGLIFMFYLWGIPSMKDIPNIITNKYEFIVGIPTGSKKINTKSGFIIWQSIEISDEKLKNMNPITQRELEKTMLIQYLPNSKYVVHIAIDNN